MKRAGQGTNLGEIAMVAISRGSVGEQVPRRVLVVDDDAELRRWVRVSLEEAGYEVIEAESALDALEDLTERKVGAVLLDRRLPTVDGTRVVRAFGGTDFPAPVVAMTGVENADEFAREIRAVATLTKPFDLAELYEVVGRAFKKPRKQHST